MKNLDLNAMGVMEMDALEMKETDGGIFGIDDLALGTVIVIIGAGIYIYNNAGDFIDGVKEGYNNY